MSNGPLGDAALRDAMRAVDALEGQFPPNVELITEIYERLLVTRPEDPTVHERFAYFLLESEGGGGGDRGRELLLRSVALDPRGHQKYFYLAQLHEGKEALELIRRGMTAAENEEVEGPRQSRILSKAFCSVVDLYTTDLCDEPEAEEEVKNSVQKALEHDPQNLNAHHAAAMYHKIVGEIQEAAAAAGKFMLLIEPKLREALDDPAAAREEDQQMSQPDEPMDMPMDADDSELSGLPNRFLRKSMGRTLIDLGMNAEARELLLSCWMEDREDAEVLMLTAWNEVKAGDGPAAEEALAELHKASQKMSEQLAPEISMQLQSEIAELEAAVRPLLSNP